MKKEDKIMLARMLDFSLNMENYAVATVKVIARQYQKSADEIIQTLNRLTKAANGTDKLAFSIKRNNELLAMVESMVAEANRYLASVTGDAIAAGGEYAYLEHNKIVSWDGLATDFNTVTLGASQIKQLMTDVPIGSKTLEQWTGSLWPHIDTIKNEATKGLIKGSSYEKITRITTGLLSGVPKQSIETIVKTYLQGINVKAQTDVYEANKDIVKKVEWSALLERGNSKTGRGTCSRCQSLDGMQWKVDDYNRPPCPLHARCRCMLTPVTISWDELGFDGGKMERTYRPWTERDAKGNLLKTGMEQGSYEDMWRKRGKKWQDNAIGPVRAELVRSGALDFNKMVVLTNNQAKKLGSKYLVGDLINIEDL